MKSILKPLYALILSACITNVSAQSVPEKYSIGLGGAASFSSARTGAQHSFFEKNGNRIGYALNLDSRYYLAEWAAVGMQYDYCNMQKNDDKVHVHFIRPALTLRYVMNRDALTFSLGIGYFNYQDRVRFQSNDYRLYSNKTSKGYCGLSFGIGYDFAISNSLGGNVHLDFLTANWFVNDDFRLYNPDKIGCDDEYEYCDKYDDGVNHHLFKNNLTFINLGFNIVFGK